MRKRRIALAVAAVVLVAGVVAGRERPAVELVQERAPRAAAVAGDDIDIDKLHRGESSLPQNDPFSRNGFGGAEAGKPVETKPVAPALPFRYVGQMTADGITEVFVMRGEELISVAEGQKLGDYRVDKVGESSIAFTYLPLKTKQRLDRE